MTEIIDIQIAPIKGPQFFLVDKEFEWYKEGADFWDDEGLLSRVCNYKKKFVAIGIPFSTEDKYPIKIYLESENPGLEEIDRFDHIVEVSLHCSTGYLAIKDENTEKASEIKLSSIGEYRLRVCFSGLKKEGDMYPENWCKIHMWKAPFSDRKVLKWWPKWLPVAPQKAADDRRTIYGVSAYLTALKEQEMIQVSKRDYDPSPELIPSLPKEYKETAFLFKDKDGCLWEYLTEPPQRLPFLRELTSQEAEKIFGYKKS